MLTVLLLGSGLAFLTVTAAWVVFRHRFRPPSIYDQPVVCLEGVGLARDAPGPTLDVTHRSGQGCFQVLVAGAVLEGWGKDGLRAGVPLTVFGVPADITHDALYRDAGRLPVLEAHRVVRGWRPRPRQWAAPWLLSAVLFAVCLVCGLTPTPAHELSGRDVVCPTGATVATIPDFRREGSWIHVCRLADGTYHGPWVRHSTGGRRVTSGAYAHGQRTGEWTEWYSFGQPKAQGTYREDQRHGRWTYWSSDGTSRLVVDYLGDELHGHVADFGANGQPRWSGNYHHGVRHGLWVIHEPSCEDVLDRRSWWDPIHKLDRALGQPGGPSLGFELPDVRARCRSRESPRDDGATDRKPRVVHYTHGRPDGYWKYWVH
jgi:hypothetical protein